jgi:hypothetical protein
VTSTNEQVSTEGRERSANSRESVQGAGWTCPPGSYRGWVPHRRPLSWLQPLTLWESRNDTVAKKLGDPVNDLRRAWMEAALEAARSDGNGSDPRVIDRPAAGDEVSFIVVGDPGEGDASQWSTVPVLESCWKDTDPDFMVVMSDVIYPAGSINEYEDKFYRPYREYDGPIYGIPGNHDWYDELHGFMFHLCGVERMATPHPTWSEGVAGWKRGLHRLLWRRPEPRHETAASVRAAWRPKPSQRSGQRTPYWAIDTGPLRVVGIDTGITGSIDRDQGAWLREVSRDQSRPKILLTGKPIYVDGEYSPGPIEGGGTVDDVVRDPANGYLAAIGGDIHNYQRYPVRPAGEPEPRVQYIVSGGGGAFMHPTYQIPKVRLPGVNEDDFRCYPRRGDSLALFSHLYDRKLCRGRGHWEITPDEASKYLAERLDLEPPRRSRDEVVVTDRVRRAAERILPLPRRARGPLHSLFALWFDLNDPPMFKSFLRIEASDDQVAIRCLAATGCATHEKKPPVEDEVVAERDGEGRWRWRDALAGA